MTDRYDDPNFMDKVWEFELEMRDKNNRIFLPTGYSLESAYRALKKENKQLRIRLKAKKKWYQFWKNRN